MVSLGIFVAGVDTVGYLVAAFLYLRVWKRLGDFLFAALACTFVLLAANELALDIAYVTGHGAIIAEIFRIAAFTLLMGTVLAKSLEFGVSSP